MEHGRGSWATIGNPFFDREYSLSCTCGWRSEWTRLHYAAEMALKEHLETAPVATA